MNKNTSKKMVALLAIFFLSGTPTTVRANLYGYLWTAGAVLSGGLAGLSAVATGVSLTGAAAGEVGRRISGDVQKSGRRSCNAAHEGMGFAAGVGCTRLRDLGVGVAIGGGLATLASGFIFVVSIYKAINNFKEDD